MIRIYRTSILSRNKLYLLKVIANKRWCVILGNNYGFRNSFVKHVIDLTTHCELDATCGQVTQIASYWSLDLVVRGSQSVAELGASSVRRAHDGRVVGQLLQHLSESRGRGVAVSPPEGAGLPTLVRALTARVRHGEDCGQGGLEALRLHTGTVRVEHDGDVPYDAEGREGRSRWHRHRRRCNRRAV